MDYYVSNTLQNGSNKAKDHGPEGVKGDAINSYYVTPTSLRKLLLRVNEVSLGGEGEYYFTYSFHINRYELKRMSMEIHR